MAMNRTKMCDIAILANGKDCISTSTDTPDTRNTFTSRLAIPRVNVCTSLNSFVTILTIFSAIFPQTR